MTDGIRRRYLHFVRHGTYVPGADNTTLGGVLDDTGRVQSRLTAEYLKQFNVVAIYTSDLLRCVQTAQIIASALPGVPLKPTSLLREIDVSGLNNGRAADVMQRMDTLWKWFFRKSQRGVCHEVLVSHGNLVRCVVCQALNIPMSTWAYVQTHNCAITSFVVGSNGRVQVVGVNECSHLPAELQTSPT
ncbi:MAG: histidine phosphatase family protein [Planctomycetes bacterium]|nr:histidine phosphatase family protein [Planctomycetota bacterium]